MKSLSLLLSLFLAPALAAQEDSSQIKVQKMIKLVGNTGAKHITVTGNTVTGSRANWFENSKPKKKKK